ncbi:MAG: TIGR03960 family B12-binding radical SAM protein [Chloroflexi bacterium]|nr:TIGR03960 family B12-binding radical SAM protein [Chloroflexota bacterium]
MQYLDEILHRVQKPARYTGGEWNTIVKDWGHTEVRVALSSPDLYEVGAPSSDLALLYHLINQHPALVAERVYAPWLDLEAELRRTGTPLFSLETQRPLADFDLWYFALDAALTYTNVLTMLDLAGIPVQAAARERPLPLILAGGACAGNGEPLADFLDALLLGEGEAALLEVCAVVRACKQEWAARGGTPGRAARQELLRRLAALEGIYIPSLYRQVAADDTRVVRLEPLEAAAPRSVHCRCVTPLPPVATRPVVPFLATTPDRPSLDLGRERIRGCQRCHGEALPQPPRRRSHDEVIAGAEAIIRHTGATSLALAASGIGDYEDLPALLRRLRQRFRDQVAVLLPELPVTAVSEELLLSLGEGRKGAFSFAPVAGSPRLRQDLGQPITDADLLRAVEAVFRAGYEHIKLAFLVGLPGETLDDVQAIVDLTQQALTAGRRIAGPRAHLSVAVDSLLPRPHTPQQRFPLVTAEELAPRIELLKRGLRSKHIKVSHAGYQKLLLEAVLVRGDRRLGPAIARAWQLGARFDGLAGHLNWAAWQQAFQETGVDPAWYAYREYGPAEPLPWGHLHDGTAPGDLRPPSSVCAACGLAHRLDGTGQDAPVSPTAGGA